MSELMLHGCSSQSFQLVLMIMYLLFVHVYSFSLQKAPASSHQAEPKMVNIQPTDDEEGV